ncbi:hypothetical protein SK128_016935 [Halocaridina rubra]|uniref:Uncharacterized protein n=1 Tax=Halocaridina rubra TaxID=373956 RepID=A0AAN8W8Z2_HALRR
MISSSYERQVGSSLKELRNMKGVCEVDLQYGAGARHPWQNYRNINNDDEIYTE